MESNKAADEATRSPGGEEGAISLSLTYHGSNAVIELCQFTLLIQQRTEIFDSLNVTG